MTEFLPMEETVSRLLKADDILLLCHKNPDGDTIGSAGALYHALRALGKQVSVLCSDGIPALYSYMQIEAFTGQYTPGYVVAIDVASIQLFGDSIREYTREVNLCIDHHGYNSGYADGTLLDDKAAATAEMLYELIPMLGTGNPYHKICVKTILYQLRKPRHATRCLLCIRLEPRLHLQDQIC